MTDIVPDADTNSGRADIEDAYDAAGRRAAHRLHAATRRGAELYSIVELRDVIDQAEEMIEHAIHQARARDHSWSVIGKSLDVSRQAARQRWSHLDDREL